MKIELGKFNKVKGAYILGSKPIQDWQRIIYVWVAIIVGIFVWSYFFFVSVQSEFKSDFKNASQFIPTKDKEAEIKDVEDKYKAKEAIWFSGVASTTNASGTK